MPRPLRLALTIVLAPIWLPFYLMVMGLGIMLGQPMIWPSVLVHLKYRTPPHDSPHSQMAPNICAKRGWAASISANRSMSGSRRKSVMFGMSS